VTISYDSLSAELKSGIVSVWIWLDLRAWLVQFWGVSRIRVMKRVANIIQLVLTILAAIVIVNLVREATHIQALPLADRPRYSSDSIFDILQLAVFYLWLVFSIVHLFVRIVQKLTQLPPPKIKPDPN
jgi:phosphate starvation-inducible membrane PsiE